jgi:DNA-binding CsgD family transcriptional regulator
VRADDSGFLDLLYNAAVDPGLWVPVMEQFADMIGGNSAWLSRLNVADGTGSGVLARIDPAYTTLYENHYAAVNPFSTTPDPRAFMSGWKPMITTDDQWVAKDDLVNSEYYNEFLAPQEVHSLAMVRLAAHDLEVCAISVHRSEKAGVFQSADLELANRLHPHLIRAFNLTEKLTAAGLLNDDMAAALDHSPFGVFLLDDTGKVRRTNKPADRLLTGGAGLCVNGGRLSASRGEAARELDALIARAASGDRTRRAGGSMVLRRSPGRSPLSVTVAPIRTDRLPVFDHRPSVVVCVTDPDASVTISQERLSGLFGLTPAEARVAVTIMGGSSVRETAAILGVSFHTVRHQMQSMLEKTGASRQSDLVGMLMRAVGPQLN